MLVIHGGWVRRRLALWAEDTSLPRSTASRARRRQHPFAASTAQLTEAVRQAGGELGAAVSETELVIELPSTAGGPLPSPDGGLTSTARTPTLAEWRLPALLVRPVEALALLDALTKASGEAAPADEGAEATPGASLRYLNVLAGFAIDLVRRGRMLPQLVTEDDELAARWRPVLTGADAAAFRDFGTAMPPVCRAIRETTPTAAPGSAATVVPTANTRLTTKAGPPVKAGPTKAGPTTKATKAGPTTKTGSATKAVRDHASPDQTAGGVLRDALDGLVDAAARRAMPERLLLGHRPGTRAPLPDRWVVALTGDDPALPAAKAADAATLGTALSGWLTSAHAANTAIRVCFRLIEPPPGADNWWLEFALQSADDPSLYVPAELVFAGATAPGLPARADELLLAGLGRGVRLFPELHNALRVAHPTGMELGTGSAFDFLSQAAPLLQAAGYGVQLPSWAGRKGVGLKLTTRQKKSGPQAMAKAGFGLAELVDFQVDLVIGDDPISSEELAELARLKVPLVRVRGQWVELDDRQLKAAISAVTRQREGELTVGDVLRQVAEGGDEDLPLVQVDADGTLGDLLSGDVEERLGAVATPAAFQGTLRPYQQRGLSWLRFLSRLGLGGILADDMGLGKTAQTLSLLLTEREEAEREGTEQEEAQAVAPTLLICPMSLVSNWQKEATRFAPSLRVYVHHGGARKREEELAVTVAEVDLVITTYGTALRDLTDLRSVSWGRVVCDEAQALKNSGTRQAQAVRAIPGHTRFALTGTPVENHLAELWSIMEFCNPGLLGPAKRFRRRYQEPIEVRQDPDAAAALKRATGPFLLRRLKTDKTIISDLPEKQEMKVWCTLTAEQASLYQAVVNDMMAVIEGSEGIERRGNVLAAMTKLKQVCNHPAHLLKDGSRLPGRSGKLARLEELAEEIITDGDKALVFTQYSEFGSMLAPYLRSHLERPVLWLHGGLAKTQRDALVERFQTEDEPMIFLLSLKAAGTGLNLTAANHVIHVDRWWNPAVEDQATDRAFRIGQSRNVQVRKFICAGTLEERIDEMIERKKALAQSVVGTGEAWISELTTGQLRELFRLDPTAVR